MPSASPVLADVAYSGSYSALSGTPTLPSGAIVGTTDAQVLTNKTINAAANTLSNLATSMFAANVVDTDGTLSANGDTRLATQKAVKTYADQLIAAADAMVFKGVINCSANPNYPAANAGDTYRVSAAGKIGGASGTNVEVGDLMLCLTDSTSSGTQAGVGANWSIAQTNIDGAVTGPASATSANIATFSGTSGKIIQDSGKSLPSGAIVGTSDSQTLTNKTITSPSGLVKADVGLGNVENTALSTWAGGTSLVTAGVITTGTWSATAIAIAKGGTGQTTATAAFDALSPMTMAGDIIVGGVSGTGTRLAKGSDDQVLTMVSGSVAWATPAAAVDGTYIVADNDNCTVTAAGQTITKTGGSAGWGDAQVVSAQCYKLTAEITFTVGSAASAGGILVGLNTDPYADDSYASIDYGFGANSGSVWHIWENGSDIANGSRSPGDVFKIVYDGVNVTYTINGSVIRTVARALGLPLFLDTAFYDVNDQVTDLLFSGTGEDSYAPSTPADWDGAPATITEALDRLAAQLATVGSAPIP